MLKRFAADNPAAIPPSDSARPALPCLVEHFVDEAWRKLFLAAESGDTQASSEASKVGAFFQRLDVDRNGFISEAELSAAMGEMLGAELASSILVSQCINAVSASADERGISHADVLRYFERKRAKLHWA